VHTGAVYLHLGRRWKVAALDPERGRAILEPFSGDWFTQPRRETETGIVRLLDRRETSGVTLSYGEVSVSEQVLGFQRKRVSDQSVIDFQVLDLPRATFHTRALWFELDGLLAREPFPRERLLGALHALEHGQIAVLPLLAMCDRWDIGGLSTNAHPQTLVPTIFIYDGHPGGVGITAQGFRSFEELCDSAYQLIAECPCRDGCPSCVQSPKCGNLNEPLSKAGARELLHRLRASR
jgi:DEAD/DEAH box helicase domain-containing protein